MAASAPSELGAIKEASSRDHISRGPTPGSPGKPLAHAWGSSNQVAAEPAVFPTGRGVTIQEPGPVFEPLLSNGAGGQSVGHDMSLPTMAVEVKTDKPARSLSGLTRSMSRKFRTEPKKGTQHDYDLRHMQKAYEEEERNAEEDNMLEELEAQLSADSAAAWRKRLIIDPRSTKMLLWDLVILLLIIYVLLVTPYDVTFLELEYNRLFTINMFVDACFMVDFLASFNVMYRDPAKGWVSNGRLLAMNYIRGWCMVDLLGNIPYDIMQLELWPRCGMDPLAVSRMRVLRMLKLVRLLRTPRVLKRLESKVTIDYGLLTMVQFLGITVIASHWLACLFGIIPVLEQADRSWTETIVNDGWSLTPGRRYAEALYFAVYTITSAGYGDVVPQTQIEIYTAVFILYFGVYFFGYIIGSITNIVASRNESKTAFHKMMDDLNAFMDENRLPAPLRIKLRDYFRYRAMSQGTRDFHGLLSMMSIQLRGEVASYTSSNWIKDLHFFRDCPEEFYIEIAMCGPKNPTKADS